MAQREPALGRWISWTLLFAAPALAAAISLAVFGANTAASMLVAIAISLAIAGIAARLVVNRIELLRRLLDNADAKAPPGDHSRARGIVGEIIDAASRTHRRYGERIAALERQAADGERIVEALAVPILIVDDDKRLVNANRAARAIVGEATAGKALSGVLRDPGVLDAVDDILAGSNGAEVELSIVDAVTRHFLAQLLPIRATNGQETAVAIALQDLTAARRIDQTRSDFIANVSHELRTPLSALIGFIETLQGPAREDTVARERFLVLMHEQAERMSRLIGDLMSLSRIELNEHSRPSGQVDVVAAAQTVVQVLQLKAKDKSVGLRLDMPDRPAVVFGDDDEITQIIQNLVDNAIKYSAEDATVDLTVAHTRSTAGDEKIAIRVRDRGDGIEAEHLPRLTERFYRVDPARSRALGGTGLGLAIVKHVVNRHGGHLEIESTPGEGSTFTVMLPAVPTQASTGSK
ncbi:MAG: ATP-binding protein [Alphaproteobacteria bacterium]|nr:ATP-binding protein [Alphaproteobacteria bacterium]